MEMFPIELRTSSIRTILQGRITRTVIIAYLRCMLVSEVVLIRDPPGDISVRT